MCTVLILRGSQGTSFYVKYFKENQVICSTCGRMLCTNILPTFMNSKMNRLHLQKIHKALQVLYLLTVVYYTPSNGYRKRGMRGLWSKTGFLQHLNHSGGMTNQPKDFSTRNWNLWPVCCSAGVLLPFREFFLMLKSGLLQCNPINSCLAYDRHGGHTICFLFAAAFCAFNDCYSPQSSLLRVNTDSSIHSRLLPDLTALLSSPSSWAQLSVYTVLQTPLAALSKGTADADPHRPFFSHCRAVTSPVFPHCVLVLQTVPAWLVNLALYWFCVRPVLQFVQFLPFESYPPICLQFPPPQHCVQIWKADSVHHPRYQWKQWIVPCQIRLLWNSKPRISVYPSVLTVNCL